MNLVDDIRKSTDAFIMALNRANAGAPTDAAGICIDLAAVTEDTGNAPALQNNGIDRIIYADYTEDESKREEYLESARALSRLIDIPFISGTFVNRFEDVKKAFYTGAEAVIVLIENVEGKSSLLKESVGRFGKDAVFIMNDRVAVSADGKKFLIVPEITGDDEASRDNERFKAVADSFAKSLDRITELLVSLYDDPGEFVLAPERIAVCTGYNETRIMSLKHDLADIGLNVNTFAGKIAFEELKTNSDGLVPCIAQDYKNGEVLMMAYMNREAFERTVRTGVMTYYSRSRQSLWVKGETSGHFQYVRELKADCDNDTLLAKVVQIGAACHTGNRSCFFNEVLKHEYTNKDISAVLRDLYGVVCDRKVNPKEGSYTNYLFNKGIDKILKKCGEEATEMVIAAKNPSHEELKYEIADLLYHMTVLMVECGVSWEEVATELANR